MVRISLHVMIAGVMLGSGSAATPCLGNDGSSCSAVDHDSNILLQNRANIFGGESSGAVTTSPVVQEPPATDVDGTDELKPLVATKGSVTKIKMLLQQHSNISALVPKDLKPLNMEQIRKLDGFRHEEESLVDQHSDELANQSHTPVYDFGAYCGYSKRFDIAKSHGALSLEQCYIFSCVEPFKASSTCGPTFYTNGQGNCKCCGHESNYYYSTATPPNYLYACR